MTEPAPATDAEIEVMRRRLTQQWYSMTVREHITPLLARLDAERARAEKAELEREELALAICGGEDAPGYANAQTVKTLVGIVRENYRDQRDRAEAAEARLATAREALVHIGEYWNGSRTDGAMFDALDHIGYFVADTLAALDAASLQKAQTGDGGEG